MDYKSKLITLREERELTKSALYGGICSKGKYLSLEDETNTTSVTISEMTAILDRLGMGWSEFIEYTDLSTKKNMSYGRWKLELLDIAQNLNDRKEVKQNLTDFIEKIRNSNFNTTQSFSIYIAAIHLCVLLDLPISYDRTQIYEFALNLYKDRNEYYVVDYEIIGNIASLLTVKELTTLADYLFPCQLNRGYTHDDIVQISATNIIEFLIKQKEYSLASEWIEKIRNMIYTKGFIKNTLTTLKLLFLKEEGELLTT